MWNFETNFKDIVDFHVKMGDLERRDYPDFLRRATNFLSSEMQNRVKKLTPIGNYREYDVVKNAQVRTVAARMGGTLKRNWRKVPAKRIGNSWQSIVYNQTKYAIYVEDGHRQKPGRFVPAIGKKLVKSYVEPRLMMEIAARQTSDNFDVLDKMMGKVLNAMDK